MGHVDDPDDLRRKADRFERLMSTVTDLRALQALRELARSYRQRVEQIIGRRELRVLIRVLSFLPHSLFRSACSWHGRSCWRR
jgi:predicted component of type VI protein secretion system